MARIRKEKDKFREKRKRGGRKYGQAKAKASKKGMWSLGIALAIFIAVAGMLTIAYLSRGKAAAYIGGLGMTAMIFSWVGLFTAIGGFKERDKSYLPCKIAVVCHLIFIAGLTAIFFRGLL